MKKVLAVLLILTLVLSLAACAKTAAPAAAPVEQGNPKVGVTIYKFDDNFMSFVRRSIEKGAEGKAELTLNDSQNNQATQNEQVDMMISKGMNLQSQASCKVK
ncbi:MAG: galactose transporter substrate-binding protein [Clostridia bacterium]|nr:galactose transporter substrate-binding protein [Clostridia bacterium]